MKVFLSFSKDLCNYFNKYRVIKSNKTLSFSTRSSSLPSSTYHKTNEVNYELITTLITKSESDCKLKKVLDEIKLAVTKGWRYPENISSDEIRKLCDFPSRSQRTEYLVYLFKREKLKLMDKIKKEERRKELEHIKLTNVNKDKEIGKNSLFLYVRRRCIHKFYNKKWATSTLFGEKIVLDLGYADYMTEKELVASVTQLKIIYSVNRLYTNPYDLYFCNAIATAQSVQLLRGMPKLCDSLLNITEKSYTDVFPKEKLVYLSPHATETLKEYDHKSIYIIGAFVDTVKKQRISFDKAKIDGIKSYSLPLDEYVMWGSGTKSLTINQVFEIMLNLKHTGDWKSAFSAIPKRKLRQLDTEDIDDSDLPDKIFLRKNKL